MEFKVNGNTTTSAENRTSKAGPEDVTQPALALLRTTRNLGAASLEVVEREIAMAISLSEQVRDGMITPQALERARKRDMTARFREDAHRTVDLAIDTGALAVNSAMDFLQKFADNNRQTDPVRTVSIEKPATK